MMASAIAISTIASPLAAVTVEEAKNILGISQEEWDALPEVKKNKYLGSTVEKMEYLASPDVKMRSDFFEAMCQFGEPHKAEDAEESVPSVLSALSDEEARENEDFLDYLTTKDNWLIQDLYPPKIAVVKAISILGISQEKWDSLSEAKKRKCLASSVKDLTPNSTVESWFGSWLDILEEAEATPRSLAPRPSAAAETEE